MRGQADILGDKLQRKGWEKLEMLAFLWALIQPGSLNGRITQSRAEGLGSLPQGREHPFWMQTQGPVKASPSPPPPLPKSKPLFYTQSNLNRRKILGRKPAEAE